ncbi:MAG: LCP family protein [bacterium]|nr:LCP family protein [bacterium]
MVDQNSDNKALRRKDKRDIVDNLILIAIAAILVVLAVQAYSLWKGTKGPIAIFNPPFQGKKEFTILLVGVDGVKEHQRTDTIMLARMNLETRHMGILSIPRDSRVEIPGYGTEKVNAAFAHGGIELTKETLKSVIGLPVDYYITVNFEGFKSFIDALGGVDVVVDKRMRYRDRSQNLNIDLQPGPQHLNGEQAMGFVRFRHDVMGDITRIGRQQQFVKAVSKRFMCAYNIARMPSLLEQLRDNVETDMPTKDLIALAKIVKKEDQLAMKSATLPGVPTNIGGVSFWQIDPEAVYKTVNDTFFPPSTDEKKGAQSQVGVEVLNGCGIAGMADQVAKALTDKGYGIHKTGNADNFDYRSSKVVVSRSATREGRRICSLLSIKDMQVDKKKDGITVIVGSDYCP